jgi:methylmalonyl-CoA/ethylmalonyl-CoA epimerase
MFEIKHHHAAMSVPNLEDSIGWYEGVLGFELERRFHIAAIPADCAMLKRDGLRIELFHVAGANAAALERRHPDTDAQTHGNKHAAFAVRDIAPVERELRARGADIVFVKKHEMGANIFIRDNAGNLIEFVEQPEMWR